jgi:signal transduction histidine kinase
MRLLAPVGILLVVVLVGTEVSMQPSSAERITLLVLFGGAAIVTVALARLLPPHLLRLRSVRYSLALAPLLAVGVAAATVLTSAGFMFLSSHDLRVFIAALGLGIGLAAVLARSLSERLEADLQSLASTAERVAAGDRQVRTGIERPDEIGAVARSVDMMIEQLSAGEEARTRLLASLGHDLRTPLSAMQAAVEALQDGVAEDPDRYLASIGSDVAVMSDLVDDLFLLSRLETKAIEFEPMPVDLAELADEAVEALAPVAARRYSPAESRVTVSLTNGGPFVTLRVTDQGPGFSPAIKKTAFTEFSTGDPSRNRRHGGAGLGLSIVRSIVEAHGGSLWIEDGTGGSVAFRVPVLGS